MESFMIEAKDGLGINGVKCWGSTTRLPTCSGRHCTWNSWTMQTHLWLKQIWRN